MIAAPTPRQIAYGDGAEATELDVVALQKSARLPIADVPDRIEVYNGNPDFDFVFIDAGSPDLTDLTGPRMFCAYAGPRWYGRDLATWILQQGVRSHTATIDETHFVAVFRASRHITGQELETVYDRMRAVIEAGLTQNGSQARPYAAGLAKLAILSMQGRWNSRLIQTWECVESTTRDDTPAIVHRERALPSGRTKFMTHNTTLGNQTMALFSIVALNQEHPMIC
jgi:hypothetical protein